MTRPLRVLVVDDEAYVRESVCEILGLAGFETTGLDHVDAAIAELQSSRVDVLLTDLIMPSGSGQTLVERASKLAVPVPAVMLSGVGTVRDAVSALKAGAWDFLVKPVDPEELVMVVQRAAEHGGLVAQVAQLRSTIDALAPSRPLVGASPAMARVRERIAQVAGSDATVLIVGESGTGKELVARAIHGASPRSKQPMVRVNCAALPSELIESELFGHKQGSFTGAQADRIGRFEEAEGGSLLLDEIGSLNLAGQAKLLRVLEDGEYQRVGESRSRRADVRVLAATNEDLAERVRQNAFRADLYYRLNVFPIEAPPLRAHKEDLGEIAFALLAAMEHPRPGAAREPQMLGPESLEVLRSYDWPGNVRELRNVLERARIVSPTGPLTPELLRSVLEPVLASVPALADQTSSDFHMRRNIDVAEKALIQRAIAAAGGKKKEASQLLGIDPRNLGYYLRKHGL